MSKEELTLQSDSAEHGSFKQITLSDGSRIIIGANSLDFFEKLLSLKPEYKIQLMDIDDASLETYLEQSRFLNILALKGYLAKKWVFRESGEPYAFDFEDLNETLFGLNMTKAKILSKLRSKKIPPLAVLKAVEWFKNQDDLIVKE